MRRADFFQLPIREGSVREVFGRVASESVESQLEEIVNE